jgi:CubicO group peptidase (beta-lactamase class C family)
MKTITKTVLLLFIIVYTSCKPQEVKNETVQKNNSNNQTATNAFENHLIPSIQIESEPRYFNIIERMKHYNIPGFSIAIIRNGKLDFAKGYGLARVEDNTPVTEKTKFKAGSIAKSITAIIVMKLRDQGKVDLDKNIEEYLTTWKLPESEFTKIEKVTLRRLLNHTAGIKNLNESGYQQNETMPTLNDYLNGKGKEPAATIEFIPGTKHNYSNIGYAIIQKVLEDITNKNIETLANDLVFKPLNMSNSTFETIRPTKENTEYSYSYNKNGKPNIGYWNNLVDKAAGELTTTATDLAKFCIAMQTSLNTDTGFLPKATAKEILTSEKGNYGLGFEFKGASDSFRFSHSGRVRGFFAYMIHYPNTGNGIVILTNSDNGGSLFVEILRGFSDLNSWDIMHPKKINPIAVSQDLLNKYIGNYLLKLQGEEYMMEIKQDGKHLYYTINKDYKDVYPLRALTEIKFIDIIDGEIIEFKKIEDKAMMLTTNDEYDYKRIK